MFFSCVPETVCNKFNLISFINDFIKLYNTTERGIMMEKNLIAMELEGTYDNIKLKAWIDSKNIYVRAYIPGMKKSNIESELKIMGISSKITDEYIQYLRTIPTKKEYESDSVYFNKVMLSMERLYKFLIIKIIAPFENIQDFKDTFQLLG